MHTHAHTTTISCTIGTISIRLIWVYPMNIVSELIEVLQINAIKHLTTIACSLMTCTAWLGTTNTTTNKFQRQRTNKQRREMDRWHFAMRLMGPPKCATREPTTYRELSKLNKYLDQSKPHLSNIRETIVHFICSVRLSCSITAFSYRR